MQYLWRNASAIRCHRPGNRRGRRIDGGPYAGYDANRTTRIGVAAAIADVRAATTDRYGFTDQPTGAIACANRRGWRAVELCLARPVHKSG